MNWYKIFGFGAVTSLFKFGSSFLLFGLLARQIEPSDYKVVPLAMGLLVFIDLFCESGITAFLNKNKVSNNVYKKLRRRQLSIAVFLYFIAVLVSFLYDFYFNVNGQFLYCLIACCVVVTYPYYYTNVGELRRDNKFYNLNFVDIHSQSLYGIAFLLLYFYDYGIYTIALSQIVLSISRLYFSYKYLKQHRSTCAINKATMETIDDYKYVVNKINSTLKASLYKSFSQNIEFYLLPTIFNGAVLSFLVQARKISLIPTDFMSSMFSSPMISFLNGNKKLVVYFPIVYMGMGLITMLLVYLCSDYFISIYLGGNWLEVGNYLKIYSMVIPVVFLNLLIMPFYLSQAEYDLNRICYKINSLIFVSAVIIPIYLFRYDSFHYANLFTLIYSLSSIFTLYMFCRYLKRKWLYCACCCLILIYYWFILLHVEF